MSVSTILVGHAIEDQWRSAFFETVTRYEIAEPLRDASVQGDYRAWTTRTATRLVREWIDLHVTELQADWELAQAGMEVKRIAPLE